MKVVILAAGHGTRMLPLTKDIPKPLICLKDKPIIHHIIDNFSTVGLNDFIIVLGYLRSKIENYIKKNVRDQNITFREQKEIIGTGNATLVVEDLVGEGSFFLTYADILCDFRIYKEMLEKFKKIKCKYMLALSFTSDPHKGAAIYLDGDRVKKIIEKPTKGTSSTHWNNAGIYILSKGIFEYIRNTSFSVRNEIELTTALQLLIDDDSDLFYYEIPKDYDWFSFDDLNSFNKIKEQMKY